MGGSKIIVNDFSGVYKGNFKRKCILGYGWECLMAAIIFDDYSLVSENVKL